MSEIPYTLTQDTILVVLDGTPYVTAKGSLNFNPLAKAILAKEWDLVPKLFSIDQALHVWFSGKFAVDDGVISYDGEELPDALSSRIIAMAEDGSNPEFLFKFWQNLKANPNQGSVDQLYTFLRHQNIPIDGDGYIVAYKAVSEEYKDYFSNSVDNSIGATPSMERALVTFAPRKGCGVGLLLGSFDYAQGFLRPKGKLIICRVNPSDVVSVPLDCNTQKLRCCKYEVLRDYVCKLASTVDDVKAEKKITKVKQSKKVVPVVNDYGDVAPTDEDFKITWGDLDSKSETELLKELTKTLRTYAARHLKIHGASKIKGGKSVLVKKILEARIFVVT